MPKQRKNKKRVAIQKDFEKLARWRSQKGTITRGVSEVTKLINNVSKELVNNTEEYANYGIDTIQRIFIEPYAYSHIKLKDLVDMHSQLSQWGIISD